MASLRRLWIENVRNIRSTELSFGPGLNLFVGDNGAGKTAVLEAVHILARGKSFRSSQVGSLIRHGEESLVVRAAVDVNGIDRRLGVQRVRGSRGPEFRVDGAPERKLSNVARLLPLQLVLPDVGQLVFGEPKLRRSWLDWAMFHVEPGYLGALQGFLQALKHRNALLRQAKGVGVHAQKPEESTPDGGMFQALPDGVDDSEEETSVEREDGRSWVADEPVVDAEASADAREQAVSAGLSRELAPWTRELADAGGRVSTMRMQFVRSLQQAFTEQLEGLAPELEVSLDYRPGWPSVSLDQRAADARAESANTYQSELSKVLGESLVRDVKSGFTGAGPHRADIAIRTHDLSASSVLSRGQGKLVALAMNVSLMELLLTHTGGAVFLIDDLGAELDDEHNARLFRHLDALGCQILATATRGLADGPFSGDRYRVFHVKQGEIARSS